MDQEMALIQQYQRLVFSIANQYKWAVLRGQVDYEDLVSEGTIGLIKAIRRYDPAQFNTQFQSFASPYVRGYIQNYLARKAPLIKIHRPKYELGGRILQKKLLGAPLDEIAGELNCSAEDASKALQYIQASNLYTLDSPLSEEGDSISQYVGEDTDFSGAAVAEFLATLSPLYRIVVCLRMDGLSQMEIAKQLNVSQMTVNRILKKIGIKLQAAWNLKIAK